jgi:lysyl-tRNA synthetase class 2
LIEQRLAAKQSGLWLRARVIQSIRKFFILRGYLEVETPLLIPAPAPETHIDAMPAGTDFLHTSPELAMKRLLCAGYPKIFQICHCFRQAERGAKHLPEFTLLEWYQAHKDYWDLMDECEELFLFLSRELGRGTELAFQGQTISLQKPWERLTVQTAFEKYTGLDMETALAQDRFDELMVSEIEPRLGKVTPTFLYDYPAVAAALARLNKENPKVAERFELYLGGLELANAFSELNDAAEQEQRFKKEQEQRVALGKTVYAWPAQFLKALPDMPPAAGIALGIDRLVMLFADEPKIDAVVAFTPEEL